MNLLLKTVENERAAMAKRIDTLNAALKSIVKHRDIEKRAIETNIIVKLKEIILSHIRKMTICSYGKDCETCYYVIQKAFESIHNDTDNPHTHILHELNPNEIRIVDLIRRGKGTKEIAEILNLAPSSVSWYRNQIRNKLGLVNAKTSLRAFLSKHNCSISPSK